VSPLFGRDFQFKTDCSRNVDRLWAIWQALNPTSYTINKRDDAGTFVIKANSTVTATTPLTPFADSTGTKYWTSEGARQTSTFNYAYPETQRWKFSSDAAYQSSVRNAVQQLYGGISNQFMAMGAPAAIPPIENVEATSTETSRAIDLESEIGKCKSLL